MRIYNCFWNWMLGHRTCLSALDLSFSSWAFGPTWFLIRKSIASGLGCWDTGLVTPASDLSIWSWTFGPASFLMTNYVCFWTWMFGDGTCHSSIGLVTLKLGLRPSCILNKKLWLFLDLDAGALDLSHQRWTCHFEAASAAPLHS